MIKVIAIVGQTATGKSDLAVIIAEHYAGEIISADSRQVYKGLDIGSAKMTHSEMRGVPHHLLDIKNPGEDFTVSEYKKLADQTILEISARGHIPILCGGTGMYIDTVAQNINYPEVPPNSGLRNEMARQSTPELYSTLSAKDPDRATSVDPYNRPRIVRSLEIIDSLGYVPPITADPQYECLYIGLELPDDELRNRIHQRTIKRITDGSLISEIRDLLEQGVSPEWLEGLGLEYTYATQCTLGKINEETMISLINSKTWQYARRQRTWFKRNSDIHWFNMTGMESQSKIKKLVDDFLMV